MTKLDAAFIEASKLPPAEQDALARWILEEMISEKRRTEIFMKSEDALSLLAAEVLAEYRTGKTKPLDLNQGRNTF